MIDKLSYRTVRFFIDAMIVGVAFYLAYLSRYDGRIPPFQRRQFLLLLVPMIVGRLVTQMLFQLHKHKWRYVSTFDIIRISQAYAAFSLVLLGLRFALPLTERYDLFRISIGVIAVEFMISLLGTMSVRSLRRFLHDHTANKRSKGEPARRILLVGAGTHGVTVANEMMLSPGMRVVGFLDDDPKKIGAVIGGVPVLGPVSSLKELAHKHRVDEVLICIPPTSQKKFNGAFPKDLSVSTRIIPTLDEMLSAEVSVPSSSEVAPRSYPSRVFKDPVRVDGYGPASICDKTILITGGAGFIGSSLAERLAEHNRVILFDLAFRHKPVGFTRLLSHPNVRAVEGSLLEGVDLKGLCSEADIVVHAAALVGVNRVCCAGRETLETNYVGTSKLLQALEGNDKLLRFIYFSTSEVFGVNSFRVDESSPPSVGPIAEARWSYAIAKLAGEHLVKAYFRETAMPIAIVRPFNIFGPKRTGEHALLRFILNALSGKPVQVHGDGSQIRSWCYIDDFCSALVQMLERPEAVGEDFNIGNAFNTLTIGDLARKVVDLCGVDVPIQFVDHPFPDISIRVPSLTKAQSLLGYKPRYDLDLALSLTIDWYRKHLTFFDAAESKAAAASRESDSLRSVRAPQIAMTRVAGA
jgi:nucleoside-diphosphate-sugar epimerase